MKSTFQIFVHDVRANEIVSGWEFSSEPTMMIWFNLKKKEEFPEGTIESSPEHIYQVTATRTTSENGINLDMVRLASFRAKTNPVFNE